ncbi:hypothetical protein GCM10022221_01820 [Actinocorallia aurea]
MPRRLLSALLCAATALALAVPGGATAVAPERAAKARPASLTFGKKTVTDNGSVWATVRLTAPAPSGGARVSVTAKKNAWAKVPSSVRVAAGRESAKFRITTKSGAEYHDIRVTAALNGGKAAGTLRVSAKVYLAGIEVRHDGVDPMLRVRLNQNAPKGGTIVRLETEFGPEQSVKVPWGRSGEIAHPTRPFESEEIKVKVRVWAGGVTRTATVTFPRIPVVVAPPDAR